MNGQASIFSDRAARGIALVAVLWIVAALAILVAGMGQTIRQQARQTASVRDATAAQAVADGAIHLTLQAVQAQAQRPLELESQVVEFGGVPVEVTLQPLSGLIDLDHAPAPLLALLLRHAGGLPAGAADALAQTLVDWRGSGEGGLRPRHFEAVEDLMLVPGIDYALLERLRPYLTTEQTGGGRVNPLAAAPDVLAVLANGNAARAAQVAAARDAGQPGVDTSGLEARFLDTGSTDRYRIQAKVPAGAGKIESFARIVQMTEGADGVPWRTLRTERYTVTAAAP